MLFHSWSSIFLYLVSFLILIHSILCTLFNFHLFPDLKALLDLKLCGGNGGGEWVNYMPPWCWHERRPPFYCLWSSMWYIEWIWVEWRTRGWLMSAATQRRACVWCVCSLFVIDWMTSQDAPVFGEEKKITLGSVFTLQVFTLMVWMFRMRSLWKKHWICIHFKTTCEKFSGKSHIGAIFACSVNVASVSRLDSSSMVMCPESHLLLFPNTAILPSFPLITSSLCAIHPLHLDTVQCSVHHWSWRGVAIRCVLANSITLHSQDPLMPSQLIQLIGERSHITRYNQEVGDLFLMSPLGQHSAWLSMLHFQVVPSVEAGLIDMHAVERTLSELYVCGKVV